MRKRNIAALLLMALLLTGLTGCAQRGDTSGVEIVVGTSERFSDEDIRGAMDAAMRAFHRGHSGCAWRTTRRTRRAGWPARAQGTTAARSCCSRVCMRATRGGAAA